MVFVYLLHFLKWLALLQRPSSFSDVFAAKERLAPVVPHHELNQHRRVNFIQTSCVFASQNACRMLIVAEPSPLPLSSVLRAEQARRYASLETQSGVVFFILIFSDGLFTGTRLWF